jgi:hypothetical protein
VIDLEGSLAYQLAAAFLSDMLNDLARVVSSPPNEDIAASYNIKNFQGQTLHSTLAEVLLCIGLAMALAASCQLEDTWCRCCFIMCGDMRFAEAVVVDTATVEALALRAHVPDVKVLYCSLQCHQSHSFLFNLLLHNLDSLGHCLSSGHLLLQESQALIFLVKACQLILDDCFDLLF